MKRLLSFLILGSVSFATMPQAGVRFEPTANSQEDSTQDQHKQSEQKYGNIVLSPDQVVIRRYVPKELESEELYRMLRDLRGRAIFSTKSSQGYQNITTLADAILIRDQAEVVKEILALAEELDRTLGTRESVDLRLLEFAPRFVPLDSARQALQPFERSVRDPSTGARQDNVTLVSGRNVIILRDTPDQVAEMLKLLTRLDVPDPQVRLRVWVAIGDPKSTEVSGLPAELLGDLTELLPGFGFRADGLSIVQTSVAIGRSSVELEIEGEEQDYSLMLRPTAYDHEGGRLTLGTLQFVRRPHPKSGSTERGRPQEAVREVLFTTSAVLNSGDFTVLGASGRAPVFLVIKVDPLDNGRGRAR